MAARKTAVSTKAERKAENQKALKAEAIRAHSTGAGVRVGKRYDPLLAVGTPDMINHERVTKKANQISSARGAKLAKAKAKKK